MLGELLGSDDVGEVGATDGLSKPKPNTNPKIGSLNGSFDGSNDVKFGSPSPLRIR